jgi:hypothetical protein
MNSSIIEKIKALLRLARSANKHEAELALQRAFELAEKHKIDVTTLDPDANAEDVTHELFGFGWRLAFLNGVMLNLCVRFFHVEICLKKPDVMFVGKPTDITIAWYVYGFLCQQCRKWLRQFEAEEKSARRKITEAKRKNFISGFSYGIASQLREVKAAIQIDDTKTALILAEREERKRHLAEAVPNTADIKLHEPRRQRGALMEGYTRGKETRINKPLTGTAAPVLALAAGTAQLDMAFLA